MSRATRPRTSDKSAGERPSLREAQRELTRQRIVSALTELIREEHPLDISMAAVADRAAVSEPTLYRYFPTKRALFGALASAQHDRVAEGITPRSADELAKDVVKVYERAAEQEAVVRWLLAAPDPAGVPRHNVDRRLAVLRTALAEPLARLPEAHADLLLKAALLVTSPMAWLYWKDYLGLQPHEAADVAGWLINALERANE